MLKKYIEDNTTDANSVLFSGMMGHQRRRSILEKKNPFSYNENSILLKNGNVFPILIGNTWKTFIVDGDVELTESNLDLPGTVFEVGKDYHCFIIDDGEQGIAKLSPNSTFPNGASAENSLKVGGFHYGHIRKVSTDGLYIPTDSEGVPFGSGATGWKNNVTTGIVPNSVWDLFNRPRCSPEGMVKVGNIWVDIYQSSAAEPVSFEAAQNGQFVSGGRLQSKYGMLPVTGTEGCSQYSFNELAARSEKRLLTYAEWLRAAYGNPGGEDGADNYGWTKTGNTARTRTGCRVNPSDGSYDAAAGIKPYAISALNIVDAVGNVWEWLDSCYQLDTGTWEWQNALNGGNANNKGWVFAPNQSNPGCAVAGGSWYDGVHAGPRAVNLHHYSWYVSTGIGVRLACDNL
jgi:formylglycine-generating enzyme required for sulfatase activity